MDLALTAYVHILYTGCDLLSVEVKTKQNNKKRELELRHKVKCDLQRGAKGHYLPLFSLFTVLLLLFVICRMTALGMNLYFLFFLLSLFESELIQ